MMHPRHQRPGVVLLLALLLMAAIVASSIAIATAVANSSHQSKNLDDFVIASLGADSGLERGLAIVKTGRSTGVTIKNATTAAASATQAVGGSAATLAVQSVPTDQKIIIPALRPLDSVTFDYFGYEQNGYLTTLSGSTTISVGGDVTHCVTPDAGLYPCNGKLEVDWIGLNTTGEPFYSGRAAYGAPLLTGSSNSLSLVTNVFSPDSDAPPSNISATQGFRITVRALDVLPHAPLTDAQALDRATIQNITIAPPPVVNSCNGSACPTGVIALTSTGAAGTSQSVKQATILWQLPATPLFNFVLFTEGDIIPNG